MLAAQAGNSGRLNWPGPNHLFLLAGPDKFWMRSLALLPTFD